MKKRRAEAGHSGIGLGIARTASRVPVDLPLALLDLCLIAASYTFLMLVRFDWNVPSEWWRHFAFFLPIACATHLLAAWLCGNYGRWWRHAGIAEARRLAVAGGLSGIVLLAAFGWGERRDIPVSVLITGPLLATALMGAVRFQSRLFAFRRNEETEAGLRVVVVGAGKTGAATLREMRENPRAGFVPVAVLDDDPSLHRRSLHGVPIMGGINCLGDLVDKLDVQLVLLAVRSGGPQTVRRVVDQINGTGIPIRIVREPRDWVRGEPLQQMRTLQIEDLLGRDQVQIDLEPVHELLHGRRVLVTGGGGWIGSEIARQVAEFEPAALALLDHDETHLHDAIQKIAGADCLLVDVRDAAALRGVFAEFAPDVVFHAAAHKHVPILEDHPCEAARTNVLGTANVVHAASQVGVTHFVFISTDKAAQPTSVMGASKWLAEQIVLDRAPVGGSYCAVRFGNVLGSRGSVIPTFQSQIDAGGPVTVTHPEMSRFFMSTTEAVSFVLLAGAVARGRRVLALDMGEQVKILDLAERMVRLSGYRAGHDIEIEIVGARPGENLSEALVGPGERSVRFDDLPLVAIDPTPLGRAGVESTLSRLSALVALRNEVATRAAILEAAGGVGRACAG